MSIALTMAGFERSLREAGVRHTRLPLAGGHFVVVTEHWGKVFGPFCGDEPATLWISAKAADPRGMKDLVQSGDWCVGGDRIWLAPEVQFNIPDRLHWDSGGAYVLPKAVDPGEYTLTQAESGCLRLEQSICLPLHNLATGVKKVRIRRTVRPARDPLRFTGGYAALREKVVFTGYSQEIELEDLSGGPAGVEVWNLAQFNPGGIVIIPTTGMVEYQDYYQPVSERYYRSEGSFAYLRFTGDRKYKIGIKAPGLYGRIGYFSALPRGSARLVVINFFNNPSSAYVDEPSGKIGAQGDSVQFYNDDGGLGGFSEIEVHGMSVGGNSGRKSTVDPVEFWQYTGGEREIVRVSQMLLGTTKTGF